MKFWNILIGKSHKIKLKREFPAWNFQVLFLKQLNRSNPNNVFNGNTFVEEKFREIITDLDKAISENIKKELLKLSDYKDNLKNEFTIKDLKKILKTKGLKLTGKKEDLVNRVIDNFKKSEIKDRKVDLKKFALTLKGCATIKTDNDRFNNEMDEFEIKIFNYLFNKEYETAFKLVSDFYDSHPFPLGLGTDWSKGFCERDKKTAIKIRNIDLDLCGLQISDIESEKIKTWLSVYALFHFNYFRKFNIEKYILAVDSDFSCLEITSYLETKPKDSFPRYIKYDKRDEIELFAQHFYSKALLEFDLNDLLKFKKSSSNTIKIEGICVIAGRDNCHMCIKGAEEIYKWNEINKIPKLPKYPGCACFYGLHRKGKDY